MSDDFGLARDSRRGSELLERLHQGLPAKERGAPALPVGDADERAVRGGRHGGNCLGGSAGSIAHDVVGARGWRRGGLHGFDEGPRKASDEQVGGAHYKNYPIQPTQYNVANRLGWCEGNVVKYITRHRDKGGAEDVRKAIHYARLLLEFEYGETE